MKSAIRFLLLCFCFGIYIPTQAQQSLLTLNENIYHLVDRYIILNSDSTPCTSIKPFKRDYVPQAVRASQSAPLFSQTDGFNLVLLENDNWDILPSVNADLLHINRSKWKNFYQYKGSFFSVNTPDFKLVVNPVLGFAAGKSNDDNIYRNTRGLELRGSIGNKVGFSSFLSENQIVYPDYLNHQIDQLQVIPGTGFIKTFGNNGYDFFNAQGYITFQANKFIDIQFGHDKNFIGNGYRSLILSDVAKENLFLKIHTHVWRFNYINLFSELADFKFDGTRQQRKKYSAFHYLNFNIIPNKLDVGVFENIVFARNDSNQQAVMRLAI
jgi:hypothetical protein